MASQVQWTFAGAAAPTQPEKDGMAILDHLQITLPAQPPPRIKAAEVALPTSPEAAEPPSLW